MNDPATFRLLFVCTGNTCRSPLAQAIAERSLGRWGWDRVEIRSAGVSASPGGEASEGARVAAESSGLSLEGHRATPLDTELVAWGQPYPHHGARTTLMPQRPSAVLVRCGCCPTFPREVRIPAALGCPTHSVETLKPTGSAWRRSRIW